MKKLVNILKVCILAAPAILATGTMSSCSDSQIGETYMEVEADSLSKMSIIDVMIHEGRFNQWLQLLKKTNYYNALRNGDKNISATVFCPTDDAMSRFLASRGVSSIDDLTDEYAKAVVQEHIISTEKITQLDFTDYVKENASLVPNLFNENLSLSYGYKNYDVDDNDPLRGTVTDTLNIYINNQACVGKTDNGQIALNMIECKNANLYEMHDVIKPLAETIYQTLQADEQYSIFVDAIKQCGYDSIANKYVDTVYQKGGGVNPVYYKYTCFAVPNEVYQANGINSVADLESYLVANSPAEHNGLNDYMQYHFLKQQQSSMASMFKDATSKDTIAYEVRLAGQSLIVNKFAGVNTINLNTPLLRSDIKTRNGTINKVGGVMTVYYPNPVNVKWDFLNSEDIIQFVNAWGSAEKGRGQNTYDDSMEKNSLVCDLTTEKNYSTITSFTGDYQNTSSSTTTYPKVGYIKSAYLNDNKKDVPIYVSTTDTLYKKDYVCINVGYSGSVTFTTPAIIKGKYDIILHYISHGSTIANGNPFYTEGLKTRFDIDGGELTDASSIAIALYKGKLVPMNSKYKLYTESLWTDVSFDETKPHTFKMTTIDAKSKKNGGNSSYRLLLDYVEFKKK